VGNLLNTFPEGGDVMLRKVRGEYVEDVTTLIKAYLELHYEDLIGKKFEDPSNCRQSRMIEIDLGWGDMRLTVTPKLATCGALERSEHREVVIESVDIIGENQHFLAFCMQEGELYPYLDGTAGKLRGKYPSYPINTVRHVQDDSDLKEWREYIKSKYHIFPPKLNQGFSKIVGDCFLITGGLTEERLGAVEDMSSST